MVDDVNPALPMINDKEDTINFHTLVSSTSCRIYVIKSMESPQEPGIVNRKGLDT